MPDLLLASSSPYKRQLLAKLGLPFSCQNPAIDETPSEGESPEHMVARLAREKAQALAPSHPDHLIIGADQVASFDGEILGKPYNLPNALAQLSRFSGREVDFVTGLCLLNSHSGQLQSCVETYTVRFRPLRKDQIIQYLMKEAPFDCAGSFKSEGLGICLFDSLTGRDPNSLIGLPLMALTDMLIKEGADPLGH